MPSSSSAGPGPEPKLPEKYKRKLTEARREQNRRSQRAWRERQKQRRDEEIRAKVAQELSKRESEHVPQQLSAMDCQVSPSTESFEAGEGPSTAFLEPPPDERLTDMGADNDASEATALPEPVLPLRLAVYYYVPPIPDAADMRHSWPVPDDVDSKTYTLPPGVIPRGSPLNSLSPSLSPMRQLSPFQRSSHASPHSDSSKSRSISQTRSFLPSPYKNHLQLVGESCFAATMSIAQSLGISVVSYVNDHPSPFSTTSNADIHTIPVDLRPTAHQLIIPHPSYLDCIPFPHFRSMAIYLSSVKKLDHMSLFLDLMHDGMVCWGRQCANGRYGRSMRDGVAWNKRSWEVRRWFWRKWSWIARMTVEDIDSGVVTHQTEEEFDDEDGMLSGSQWWWSLHDDDEGPLPSGDVASSSSDVVPAEEESEELGSLLSRHEVCNVGIRSLNEADLLVSWD
ncbi:uncharacterized protein Z520_10182 [Fonsecaea multimorphosa CBS 102226]|uniref:BZIP domain-containing protein n=1 Tax=Fonsecaea multimorphosa CBS 102226 TaxID=1442371 RepID=A0A0D2IAH2_9EURO|nr:uncharacterized protein Z520_10182 [Fonsecaea multimorphosa CBS 102226]KIX94156.1 hypothetical protein Z520_10182 [Fonsecaea multimorphosa CBS 102226]OAL19509.1 hypothetical protein AYO22_09671 [Fonsecaea multimorphosa]